MSARRDLPPELGPHFRVAEARAAGVSRRRLEASDLRRAFHGVRSADGDLRRALTELMAPSQAFAGPTAARLWDLPLPRRLSADDRLHVCTSGRALMRRPGIVASRNPRGRVVTSGGLRLLDPISTWISLARYLEPWDLTAIGDRIVTGTLHDAPYAGRAELLDRLGSAGRFVGIAKARRAAADVRIGSWSRPETLLRLRVVAAGLPEPVLNAPAHLEDGRHVIPDLSWPEVRIAVEYDGRWHDADGQHDADSERHERLIDAGWMVVRVRAGDLFGHPSHLVARLIRRFADRGVRIERAVPVARMPRFEP